MGFGSGDLLFAEEPGGIHGSLPAGQEDLIKWMEGPPKKILDLTCSDGRLGELLRLEGHTVIGIDAEKFDGIGERLDGFIEADLSQGLPREIGEDYDVIIA